MQFKIKFKTQTTDMYNYIYSVNVKIHTQQSFDGSTSRSKLELVRSKPTGSIPVSWS